MSRKGVPSFFVIAWLGALALPAAAQNAETGDGPSAASLVHGDVPHTSGDVTIDGLLDDAIWRDALVVELDYEVQPAENGPPAVRTFAYLIEDGTRLLVGFDARDPEPDRIRAYLRDRDTAYGDDFVGVVLDTFNDERRAFEFFVNALGVQMDLTVDDVNGGEDDSWDALWESAGRIGDEGYSVEMAIPFSQLRFRNTDGPQTWGVDVLRVYPRQDRALLTSSPRERGRNCYLCRIGKVRGFARAEPGKGLEVVPYVTAGRTDERDPAAGSLVDGDADGDGGVSVRWGITPDLVANLALNPDFSQVEADVAQLDVNNRFALFFPETRPFFLEGRDFFATPIEAVFTRTIADPDFGAKLTGTTGANTYGIFAAEDTVTNLLFPGPLGSSSDALAQDSRTLVGRYRRDIGANSTVGALFTSRSGDGYRNSLAGFDGRYRPSDRHSIRFQYLSSSTRYPDEIVARSGQPAGSFDGDAVELSYNFSAREWFANANYASFDPGFRADSGFVRRVDVEEHRMEAGHVWHGDDGRWFNRMTLGAETGGTEDAAGRRLEQFEALFFNMQMPLQSFMFANVSRGEQLWDGRVFDTSGAFVFAETQPISGLSLGSSLRVGKQIDFANSRLGDEVRFEPFLNWNATRRLLLRFQYTSSRLEAESGEPIFDADLVDLRLTWQFNLRSYLRLTLQDQVVERNLALFDDPETEPRTKTRGTQLLYSYQLNPRTVFYLGYSDNQLQNQTLPSLTKTDRTFFTKFSYAWVP